MDVMALTSEQLRAMVPDEDLDAYIKASGTGMPTLADFDKLPDCEARKQMRRLTEGMRDSLRRLMIYGITHGFPKPMPSEVQEVLNKIQAVSDWAKKHADKT